MIYVKTQYVSCEVLLPGRMGEPHVLVDQAIKTFFHDGLEAHYGELARIGQKARASNPYFSKASAGRQGKGPMYMSSITRQTFIGSHSWYMAHFLYLGSFTT